MSLQILYPEQPADSRLANILAHEGLVVMVGGHAVSRDLCQHAQSRARVIAQLEGQAPAWVREGATAAGTPSVVRHSALWVYTGVLTRQAVRKVHYGVVKDPQTIAGLNVTSPERTALDLLLADLGTGVEHLAQLIRAGASLNQVRRLALSSHGQNIRRVRAVLLQLPDSFAASCGSR